MSYFVTGATGFIGRHLLELLLKREGTIHALVREGSRGRLDELARRLLIANDDRRQVTADVHARYFGAELDDRTLTPGDDARIAPTRFEDWLSQSAR